MKTEKIVESSSGVENPNPNISNTDAKMIISKLLSKPQITISNLPDLERKICQILLTPQKERIGVITDFDRTITSASSLSSHGIVERCDIVAKHPTFFEQTQANSDKVRDMVKI